MQHFPQTPVKESLWSSPQINCVQNVIFCWNCVAFDIERFSDSTALVGVSGTATKSKRKEVFDYFRQIIRYIDAMEFQWTGAKGLGFQRYNTRCLRTIDTYNGIIPRNVPCIRMLLTCYMTLSMSSRATLSHSYPQRPCSCPWLFLLKQVWLHPATPADARYVPASAPPFNGLHRSVVSSPTRRYVSSAIAACCQHQATL